MVVKLLKRLGPVVVVTRKKNSSSEVEKLQKQLENVKGQLRNIRNVSQGAGQLHAFPWKDQKWTKKRRLLSHSVGRAPSGEPSTALLCIELCAACARLLSVMHIAGFKVVAVDHSKTRYYNSPARASMWTWLVKRAWNTFMGLLSQPQNPLQLWSRSFPCGLPNLTNLNQKKIDTANSICKYQQNSEKDHRLHRAHRKSKEKLYVAHAMDATAYTGVSTFSNFFSTMCTREKRHMEHFLLCTVIAKNLQS